VGGRLRVIHVITKLELGGAQENTLYTLAHLDPGRFSGLLVTHPAGVLVEDALRAEGYGKRFLPSLVREIRPHRDARCLLELTALLRAELRRAPPAAPGRPSPVIVHTHSSKAGILGRAAARLAGVPIVVHSVHGYGFHPYQHPLVRRFYVALERRASRWTTHVIAVSRADRETGLALGLFPADRVSLVRSGIEIERYAGGAADRSRLRQELGVDPARPLVGMVACLKPQKNPVDFVRLAARVAAQVPGAQFVLAGDGVLRPAVEAEARRLGLGAAFRLLGWRRDVPAIIPALDVLVLTSLWEGLPRVFPQAMAAARPIVAYRVAAAPEAVAEGVSGYLVEPGDWEGAAARVVGLLRDPPRAAAMGRAGAERVREFDAGLMVRQQEELYERLWAAAQPR
jgi:glycosyltransferase involved in cell wall biosynthesis